MAVPSAAPLHVGSVAVIVSVRIPQVITEVDDIVGNEPPNGLLTGPFCAIALKIKPKEITRSVNILFKPLGFTE